MYRVVYIVYSTFSNHMYVVSPYFPAASIYGYMQKRERERERESGGVSLAFAMWDLQSSQSYGVVFVLYCA